MSVNIFINRILLIHIKIMFSAIVAAGIGSASAYGFYFGVKGYKKTNEDKKKLAQNSVDFEDLATVIPNTKTLTSATVQTNSGLLEVFKVKERTEVSYVRADNSNFFFINPNISKKHIFSQLIDPKFGLEKYIPSLDDKSYLLDDVLTEKSEGSGNIIGSDISARYGLGNLLLSSSNKYLTVFYPLRNKTIFMYGFTNSSGDFVSEFIGTNKHQVVNRVFKSQSDDDFNKIFLSVFGFMTAIGVAVISRN